MYQAKYQAEIDGKVNSQDRETVTIAGKYCESGDILIRDINLPKATPGDLLVVFSTGAYNYSMSSNYNRSTKAALVLVADGKDYLAIKRESLEDLLRNDLLPEHLNRGVL
jgi:diaminopimelate decarboxylase